MEVPLESAKVKINALTNGLRDEDLFSSLVKKLVEAFDELLRRAEKHVTLEEVRKAKKTKVKSTFVEKKKGAGTKSANPDVAGTTRP